MTKYISDVQTVEEAGTTGIRITVSEDIGETTIRAVNTVEFENIESEIKSLQEKGITTDNLETYVNKLSNLNASKLEGHPASYYAKATDLTGYAKETELEDYKKICDEIWVGRISRASSSSEWDYTSVEGIHNNYIRFSSANTGLQGFCLLIRPGGYTETNTTIPIQLIGFKNGEVTHYSYGSRDCSIQTVTWKDNDGSKVTEKCLIYPIAMSWTDCTDGQLTCNYKGRCITRLWEYS